MDPLRQDIKKLMDSTTSIILEKDDLIELLDGRVDGVIAKHRSQDDVFSQVLSEPLADTPRIDIEDDGVIDTQQYTKQMAEQIITSFKNEYDEDVLKDLETLRTKKSRKAKRQVRDYDETLAIVEKLKKQHNIK